MVDSDKKLRGVVLVNAYTPQKDKTEDDYIKDVLEKIKDLKLVGTVY
jgi:hypothetical protein